MLRRSAFVVAVLLMLPLMPMVFGQAQLISGTVVDQSGGVLPGATVQVIDQVKSSLVRELVTDDGGRFQALNVQPGVYTIKVELAGFQTLNLTDVKLDVNVKLDVGRLEMKVGEVATVVSVTGEIPMVQTNTMEKSFFVEEKQVSDLPMNARNWTALMRTVPGVTMGNRSNLELTFNDVSAMHVGGGRGSQNNFYLDGTPNLDVGDNQSQYTQPSIDAVAEFRVQMSSFNAEYGRNSGMVVAVQTKSGGSDFHGSLYEYARNDWFDAVNPIQLRTPDPNDREKQFLNRHQFGGSISGWVPFPKLSTSDNKRLFFFYNREMTRQLMTPGGGSFADLPGPAILSGDFRDMLLDTNMEYAPQFKNGTIFQPGTVVRDSQGRIIDGVPFPNNTVPQNLWVPASANILKLFGPPFMPDVASLPDAPRKGFKRYFFNSPNKFNKDQDLLRVDYVINDSTTSYFRWVNDDQWERLA
ncbi:MAG TPA: carboxypeptidase regulatory-like domain-containing protein, partial [Acidobacteriota bacterium]|nr:carboxypeptidase regulatory-like domain-containing protein [Acidobacteriota bacterium]